MGLERSHVGDVGGLAWRAPDRAHSRGRGGRTAARICPDGLAQERSRPARGDDQVSKSRPEDFRTAEAVLPGC